MESHISEINMTKFKNAVFIDFSKMKKQTSTKILNNDIENVRTYQDLHDFKEKYNSSLSFLSETQLELILKCPKWKTTVYAVLAANRFKKAINK